MSKETKQRVSKAFHAMKEIGISEDKTKAQLKKLLKLYDKNWELIEEENYRVLADAIFESEEAEASGHANEVANNEEAEHSRRNVNGEEAEYSRRNVSDEEAENSRRNVNGEVQKNDDLDEAATEEPERPLKRLRLRYQEGPKRPINNTSSPSIPNPPLIIPKEEPDVSLETRPINLNKSRDLVGSTQPNGRTTRDAPQAETGLSISKKKGKQPISTPNGEPTHALIKPKDEPLSDDMQQMEVRVVTHPARSPVRDNGGPVNGNKGESKNFHGESSSSIEIASSSFGEVKVSLSYNLSVMKSHFHTPNLEEVFKSVEDRYLESNKTLDPKFSVTDLMKETCEWFLKVGTDPINRSLASPLTRPVDTHFDPEVAVPQTQLLLHEESLPNNTSSENNGTENQLSLVAVDPVQSIMGSLFDAIDTCKGQEKVIITLVNEVNNDPPPFFQYIPQSTVYQNAYLKFSLSRIEVDNCCPSCYGDCLSISSTCACGLESGDEFAYTYDGLVKEEFIDEWVSMSRALKRQRRLFCKECPLERSRPCKGHLAKKFIKECWLKCGCDKGCGNRVVQRGITRNLQVFMTPEGKGWGLRTLEDLPKGAFVCEYIGEVLTNTEFFGRAQREKHSYSVILDSDWGSKGVMEDEKALCLDATCYGNVARFINHRCHDSNLVEIPVEVETPDRYYYHLAFFTTRKVKAMEELTRDYGIDFDDNDNPIKAFRCLCGSKFCRTIKR